MSRIQTSVKYIRFLDIYWHLNSELEHSTTRPWWLSRHPTSSPLMLTSAPPTSPSLSYSTTGSFTSRRSPSTSSPTYSSSRWREWRTERPLLRTGSRWSTTRSNTRSQIGLSWVETSAPPASSSASPSPGPPSSASPTWCSASFKRRPSNTSNSMLG